MQIPTNIIATADDLGLNPSINRAILNCFELGYINSTSFITNTIFFDETVNLIHENSSISNIGVHVNLAEGKPVSNFNQQLYLDENGNWNLNEINNKFFLNTEVKAAFLKEIYAQIEKALANNVSVTHLDSHYHIHTLPAFYKLFLQASKHFKLRLRLAQTFYEDSYLKFLYRKYVNIKFKESNNNYSDRFETVIHLLGKQKTPINKTIEIMLHPDYDASGGLTDHFDKATMKKWLSFLQK